MAKLSDYSLTQLREMLAATIRSAGADCDSADIIRREIARQEYLDTLPDVVRQAIERLDAANDAEAGE